MKRRREPPFFWRAAAANLGRAGLKDDARTQLDWLRKNVKDPENLELIRREMQKL